ncbi:hypothetical protein OH76DRAFT_769326 [Lentinus brumalis]|uniref:Uncharacterized protein n=1 Tax=Lentinus brumalis TaxID=2498619 RepID=A0A371D4N6_9APHY|nr:hypothetical protein OH76DRAFT_769326 [Polyporus brumalis]
MPTRLSTRCSLLRRQKMRPPPTSWPLSPPNWLGKATRIYLAFAHGNKLVVECISAHTAAPRTSPDDPCQLDIPHASHGLRRRIHARRDQPWLRYILRRSSVIRLEATRAIPWPLWTYRLESSSSSSSTWLPPFSPRASCSTKVTSEQQMQAVLQRSETTLGPRGLCLSADTSLRGRRRLNACRASPSSVRIGACSLKLCIVFDLIWRTFNSLTMYLSSSGIPRIIAASSLQHLCSKAGITSA